MMSLLRMHLFLVKCNIVNTIVYTIHPPYLALTDELWGVCCADFGEIWPHYNGTAQYWKIICLLGNVAAFYFHILCNEWHQEQFELHANRHHWWWVNAWSGSGLVPSGNKPLPEPIGALICMSPCGVTCPQWVNRSKFTNRHSAYLSFVNHILWMSWLYRCFSTCVILFVLICTRLKIVVAQMYSSVISWQLSP